MSEVFIARGSVPVQISYFPFSTDGPCHPFQGSFPGILCTPPICSQDAILLAARINFSLVVGCFFSGRPSLPSRCFRSLPLISYCIMVIVRVSE